MRYGRRAPSAHVHSACLTPSKSDFRSIPGPDLADQVGHVGFVSLGCPWPLLAQSCQSLECPFPGAAGLPVEHLDFSVWTHMRNQRRDVVSEVNPRSQASCLVFSDPRPSKSYQRSQLCALGRKLYGVTAAASWKPVAANSLFKHVNCNQLQLRWRKRTARLSVSPKSRSTKARLIC